MVGVICLLLGIIVGMSTRDNGAQAQDPPAKGPKWQHGLDLKARPNGELNWDKAKKYGIEVFKDENNGNTIYITEAGNIAVVPGK